MSHLTLNASAIIDYIRTAEVVMQDLVPHLPVDRRSAAGGVFCLAHSSGRFLASFVVGVVPAEKHTKYWELAHEKVSRMLANGHTSSRETREPAAGKWAGALCGKGADLCAAFSGLPENFDEVLVARVLVNCEDLSLEEARLLLHDNTDFRSLFASGKIPWD